MARLTTIKTGNWSDPTTWDLSRAPGSGDTVWIAANLGHSITLDVNVTVGDDHATDAYAIYVHGAGADTSALVIAAGKTLTLKGSVTTSDFWNPDASSVRKTLHMEAGSKILFDVPSGATYQLRSANYGGFWTAAGTEASPVIIGKVPGSQGDAHVGNSPSGPANSAGQCDLTWVRFEGIGSANIPAFVGDLRCTTGLKWQHVRFVDGGIAFIVQHSNTLPILLDDVRMTGTVLCTSSDWGGWISPGSAGMKIDGDSIDHTTRHLTNCAFDRYVNVVASGYFTISGCVFGANLGTSASGIKAFGPNNVVNLDTFWETEVKGPISESYFLKLGTEDNPHFLVHHNDLLDSIFEAPRAYQTKFGRDWGEVVIGGAAGNTFRGNLALPVSEPVTLSPDPDPAGTAWDPHRLGVAIGTMLDTNPTGTGMVVEHNTIVGYKANLVHTGEGGTPVAAGTIASVRSNLTVQCENYSPSTGIVLASTPVAATQVFTDQAGTDNQVTTCDYNAFSGLSGSAYTIPHTGTTFGAHDVTVTDPQFVDSKRIFSKWGQVRAGADGTVEGALAALAADPTKTADLVTWVKAGWAPQNSALLTAAHNGTAIGAVQPGSGPSSPVLNIDTGSVYGQPNSSGTNDFTGTGLSYNATKQQTPNFNGTVLGSGLLSWITRRVDSDPVHPRDNEFMYAYRAPEGQGESGAVAYPSGGFGAGTQDNSYAAAGLAVTVFNGSDYPQVQITIDHPYEAYPEQSDTDPAATPPYTILAPIPPTAAVQGWTSHVPPSKPHGGPWNVHVVAWGDGSAVPTTGANAIYAGIDNGGTLRLRVFDWPPTEAVTLGSMIHDKNESTFNAGHADVIAALKASIPSLLPPHQLTGDEAGTLQERARILLLPDGNYWWDDPMNGDMHMIAIDRETGLLYELYKAYKDSSHNWHGGGLAIYDLTDGSGGYRGNGPAQCSPGQTRPLTWTSGNAAGTPMFPLTIRYDEVTAGSVDHVISANFPGFHCANRFVWPASHFAGNMGNWDYIGLGVPMPFGTQLRLKSDWYEANKTSFGTQSRVVLDALKKYGVVLSDINSGGRGSWRQHLSLSFLLDARWQWTNDIEKLWNIPVAAFEVVQTSYDLTIAASAPSGQVGDPVTLTVTWATRTGDHVNPGNDMAVRVLRVAPDPPNYIPGEVVGTVYLSTSQRTATVTHTPTVAGNLIYEVDSTNYGLQGGRTVYTALSEPPPLTTGYLQLATADGHAIYLEI